MSASKTWPARLVATVTALAFVFACTFGTYAHAAGHNHHADRQAAQGVGEDGSCLEKEEHIHSADGQVGHAHVGHDHAKPGPTGHEGGDANTSAAECCCMLCHFGHAILVAAAAVIPHPVRGAPSVQPAAALHGAPPSGLERPPKVSVRA